MAVADSPNAVHVAWSTLVALRKRRPAPRGTGTVDHSALAPLLTQLAEEGVATLPGVRDDLHIYRKQLEQVDPDGLTRDEALAYWLNLYNAGALDLAAEARDETAATVLRVPGGFSRTWANVADENLSLHDIEHAKLRRFQDPRIHAAMVCGSASCPTLRYEPFEGSALDDQLDDQMTRYLAGGAARVDRDAGTLSLSRVFLWYGGDFVRPHRMPTWLSPRRKALVDALLPWLDPAVIAWVIESRPSIRFQAYDWSLACSVG